MQKPFPDSYKEIADSMGITLYQRFNLNEASLFLRCPAEDVIKLQSQGKLNFIEVTKTEIQFFGYQLLEHLLENVTNHRVPSVSTTSMPERILRAKEVVELTGLSRTTIWRMERAGAFPNRVSLGVGSVGWRLSEVSEWVNNRQHAL